MSHMSAAALTADPAPSGSDAVIDIFGAQLRRLVRQMKPVIPKSRAKRIAAPAVMKNVKLTLDNGRLSVTGCDLDIEVTAKLDVQSVGTVTRLVPFSLLEKAARQTSFISWRLFLPANEAEAITLQTNVDGPKVSVIADTVGVCADFATLRQKPGKPEDAPRTMRFSLPSADLGAGLAALADAISTEETRYYLNGVNFDGADGTLRLVATDGHRLHSVSRAWQLDQAGSFILPLQAVKLLRKLCAAAPEGAEIAIGQDGLLVTFSLELSATESLLVRAKTIDGTYPNWRKSIPIACAATCGLNSAAWARSMRMASSLAEDGAIAVRLAFRHSMAQVPAGVEALRRDCVSLTLEAEEVTFTAPAEFEDVLELGFKQAYLADIFASASALGIASVNASLGQRGSPSMISGTADAWEFMAIIMPIRLQGRSA